MPGICVRILSRCYAPGHRLCSVENVCPSKHGHQLAFPTFAPKGLLPLLSLFNVNGCLSTLEQNKHNLHSAGSINEEIFTSAALQGDISRHLLAHLYSTRLFFLSTGENVPAKSRAPSVSCWSLSFERGLRYRLNVGKETYAMLAMDSACLPSLSILNTCKRMPH